MNMAERNPCVYNRLEPYEKKLARDRILNSTLSDICLNSIVKHFDRHMVAHKSGRIPKHYEFLQRAYSEKLFAELSFHERRWLARYQDFLLNEYIKEVTLISLFGDMEFAISCLFNIGATLKKLTLGGDKFTEDILCSLPRHIPNVESLSISHSPLTAEGLRNIMQCCASLEHLKLDGCLYVTDDVIRNIFQVENAREEFACKYKLKELDLRIPLTDVAISRILKTFPNLTCIAHENTYRAVLDIYAENLKNNVLPLKTYNLTKLILNGTEDSDESGFRICNVVCPHLVKLAVSNIQTQGQIDVLTGLSVLREINFYSCIRLDLNFSSFLEHNGKKLETIKLHSPSHIFLSVKTLIESCPNIQIIDIKHLTFEPIEPNYVPRNKLNKLKCLSLSVDFSMPYSIESVNTLLLSSPNLEVFNMIYCKFLPLFINSITDDRHLRNIRELDIFSSGLDLQGLKKVLLAFSRLEKCVIQSDLLEAQAIKNLVEELPSHVNKVWINQSDPYYLEYITELYFLQKLSIE